MKLAIARLRVILLFASLLQACGGGGGYGSDPPPPPPPDPPTATLSVSTSTVSVSSTAGEPIQIENVTLTISNPPEDDLHLDVSHSDSGIDAIDVIRLTPAQTTLAISFRAAGSLPNDTYSDSITVRACIDPPCVRDRRQPRHDHHDL